MSKRYSQQVWHIYGCYEQDPTASIKFTDGAEVSHRGGNICDTHGGSRSVSEATYEQTHNPSRLCIKPPATVA